MSERNSINNLFEKLKEINVFDKDFSSKIGKTYEEFFQYNHELAGSSPRECDLDRDKISGENGRFSVDYKGAHFEGLFQKGKNENNLVVTFGVARTVGGKLREQLPYFPRWTWAPFIDGHFLCIEDPMYYQFQELKLGWFYGNKDEDYAVFSAEIIRKVAEEMNIKPKDIILYGSSGGGTAAIRAGAALPGSKVVAINAQLDICNYNHTEHFMETTNIDLFKEDKFLRNDLPGLMKKSAETDFLIIINAESRPDIEIQLKNFLQKMQYNQKVTSGLTKFDNIVLWIYDAIGKAPHNIQENYRIYPYIRLLLDSVREKDFIEKYQHQVLYINDWWRYQAKSVYESQQLRKENQILKKERDRLYKERLKHLPDHDWIEFSKTMTARIDIGNLSVNGDNTELEWITISDQNASIQAPIGFKYSNGQIYMVHSENGILSFSVKCIGDGELNLALRGIYRKDTSGQIIPAWIDYMQLDINGRTILDKKTPVWHNKPYKIFQSVRDGEIISCTMLWKEHTN